MDNTYRKDKNEEVWHLPVEKTNVKKQKNGKCLQKRQYEEGDWKTPVEKTKEKKKIGNDSCRKDKGEEEDWKRQL